MALRLSALIGIVLALAACGAAPPAGEGPQAGAPAGETSQPEPAGETSQPEPATPQPATQTGAGETITQVAQPGSADMGAVTPVATGEGGDLVEQPRPGSPGARPQVDRAVADAAQRAGVMEGAVAVQSVEAVDWPDGGLGCPDPAATYLQAIVPGYRIVLEAAGQSYTYHTDTGTTMVLCVNGRPAS